MGRIIVILLGKLGRIVPILVKGGNPRILDGGGVFAAPVHHRIGDGLGVWCVTANRRLWGGEIPKKRKKKLAFIEKNNNLKKQYL